MTREQAERRAAALTADDPGNRWPEELERVRD
jgi:hypothetical protein